MTEAWLASAADGMERLKWLVLRAFSVLPSDAAAEKMTDADYVWCGLQMLLDAAQKQSAPADEAGGNPGFAPERFEELGGGV